MEKFNRWSDPGTGINPFVPLSSKRGRSIGSKIYQYTFHNLKKGNQLNYPKMVSAITHGGFLWVSIEHFPRLKLYDKVFKSDYHVMDYNLFWMNIRENFYHRMSTK